MLRNVCQVSSTISFEAKRKSTSCHLTSRTAKLRSTLLSAQYTDHLPQSPSTKPQHCLTGATWYLTSVTTLHRPGPFAALPLKPFPLYTSHPHLYPHHPPQLGGEINIWTPLRKTSPLVNNIRRSLPPHLPKDISSRAYRNLLYPSISVNTGINSDHLSQ